LTFFVASFLLILHKLKYTTPNVFISLVLLAFMLQFIASFTLDLTKIVTSLSETDGIYVAMRIIYSLGAIFKQTAINYFVYQAKQVLIKV
jgi:hypothetical protein